MGGVIVYCNKCGNKLDEEDLFCRKCGSKRKENNSTNKINEEALEDLELATSSEEVSSIQKNIDSKAMIMTSPVPFEDESVKYRKIYWISGAIIFLISGLNIFAAIIFGWVIGFLVRNFGLCAKLAKVCKQEYFIKEGVTKNIILNKSTENLMKRGFKVSDTSNYLVVTSNEYKNIEYKIFINEDTSTFKIDTFYNIKGRILNKRLYYKLYKSAVANNGIIAYTIQNGN